MEYTFEQIEQAYTNLPKKVRVAMLHVNIGEQVNLIGEKYKINIEQKNTLYSEIMLVVVGLKSTVSFEEELKQLIKIPEDKYSEFVIDINNNIFLAMREDMQNTDYLEELDNEVPEKAEVVIEKKNTDVDLDLDDDQEITQAVTVQNIELPTPKVSPAPTLEKITPVVPNIAEKKLTEAFSIPKVTSDHSIPAIKKEPSSGVDPYREPLQ